MNYTTDFQKQIENAFLTYSAYVAQERAIPDVRDMLKIGLRQGLYAQYTNKLTHKDKFQKAQKSVAAAMTQSYVHGDAAMYDTFVRAARPWSYRYPLEDVQGQYGNPTSPDSHAAARYVELKTSELSDYFFAGLKKNAIGDQYYSNYDDTEMIPAVFPSIGYWNIVNGCSGIAVAMATSVPCFNLKEVNEALIKIIKNPNVSFDNIYCIPDFPTGGTIINSAAIKESLRYGKGDSIKLRANLQYFPDQNMIKATQLPYGVFTNTIIDQLASLTTDNPSYGIEKVVDHTKKEADIRIYLSKGINPNKMIDKLYKDTSLENWFSVNMILLDKGRFPKVFGWREACDAYIAHIRECEYNIIKYDLDKALARKNIVDGLIRACSIMDEIVALIRGSNSPAEAKEKLISIYSFNEEQAKAILAMKLSSLTRLDVKQLNDEAEELTINIQSLTYLLNDSTALDAELIKILNEVAAKFGDARRTKIIDITEPSEEEPKVKEEEINIMLFDNNTIRIIKKDDMQGAKRGRKGTNLKPPKNSNLIKTLYSTNLGTISAFTNQGRMYSFTLSDLDCDKDYSIYELIQLQDKENVILLIDTTSLSSYHNLITISKNGYVKKTSTSEYMSRAKKGIAAVKLEENDNLINVFLSTSDDDKVFIVSSSGNYNYYKLQEVSATGRATKGVKAIKLSANEMIKTATIIRQSLEYKGLLTINSEGTGKITPLNEYNETNRGLKGNKTMGVDEVAVVYAIPTEQEKIYLTANSKAVLIDVNTIPIQSRLTSGARIIDARGVNTTIEVL